MSSGSAVKTRHFDLSTRKRKIATMMILVLFALSLIARAFFIPAYATEEQLANIAPHEIVNVEYATSSSFFVSMKQALRLGDLDLFGPQKKLVIDEYVKKRSDWCTEAEYLDGEWVKRDEEITLQRLREIYKYTDRGKFECQANNASYGDDPVNENDPKNYPRILETAQYEYKPKSGCRKHEWDPWNFAKYCLRSKGGCSLVGDSLADQIYRAVHYSMVSTRDSLFLIHGSPDRIWNVTVNRDHPLAARLIDQAGVTETRLKRPVFNYWREHHLVHRHELDEVMKGLHGYVPWVNGPSLKENGWIFDRSWWFELWSEMLTQPIRFVAREDDGVVPREEASTISLNSGPHWGEFELFPKRPWHLVSDDDVIRGWVGAFTKVLQKIGTAAAEHDVIAWWRSNVPGHVDCKQYTARKHEFVLHSSASLRVSSLHGLQRKTTALITILHLIQKQKGSTGKSRVPRQLCHTYSSSSSHRNLYPIMDRYASTRLGFKPSDMNYYLNPTHHSARYLDLWSISIKRPDAHLKGNDCSHFCLPAVPNEWLQFMWHLMVTAAKNDDYDG
ncbi:hypothetical protein QFC21_005075 [Naganishia friedmannii]|uniref:Uncharacterized protein n=1 Tax=Naganishia friedmannii TaxID=89922 RepID=A0ACC2VBQ0_9TREE|nr:hypothetical protein QFC21_005075 [Naganishia friedmannii]